MRVGQTTRRFDYFVTAAPEGRVTVEKVQKGPDKVQRQKVMREKLKSKDENGTWTTTALSPGRTAVQFKTVFRWRPDDNGYVVRHKALLMAEFFSKKNILTSRKHLRRLFYLQYCYFLLRSLWQMDDTFIMRIFPAHFWLKKLTASFTWAGTVVCRSRKGVCIGWRSSHDSVKKLKKTVKRFSFRHQASCECVFKIKLEKVVVVVLVYVFDMIILGFTEDGVKSETDRLGFFFKLLNLEEICSYDGVTFEREENKLSLLQTAWSRSLFDRFRIKKVK